MKQAYPKTKGGVLAIGRRSQTFRTRLKGKQGQYLPISAMVMFTIAVFMVAILNVYKVSQAKLIAQNLAQAAALNISAKQAQVLNHVNDRNEWLNNITHDPLPRSNDKNHPNYIPNLTSSMAPNFIFDNIHDVRAFASLVQAVNDAQRSFSEGFQGLIGAYGPGSSRTLADNQQSKTLTDDIPALKDVQYYAWNNQDDGLNAELKLGNPSDPVTQHQDMKIRAMKFNPETDLKVNYYEDTSGPFPQKVLHSQSPVSISEVNGVQKAVGWMTLQSDPNLTVNVPGAQGSVNPRMGAGVMVMKTVYVLGQPIPVKAKAMAYIVNGGGQVPTSGGGQPSTNQVKPGDRFSPTYYVKLAPATLPQ